eukprot:3842436-Rhodomonas_salina.1
MENVRPVRLMTTSYKGLTSTIDSRLKKEMEHLGIIECWNSCNSHSGRGSRHKSPSFNFNTPSRMPDRAKARSTLPCWT